MSTDPVRPQDDSASLQDSKDAGGALGQSIVFLLRRPRGEDVAEGHAEVETLIGESAVFQQRVNSNPKQDDEEDSGRIFRPLPLPPEPPLTDFDTTADAWYQGQAQARDQLRDPTNWLATADVLNNWIREIATDRMTVGPRVKLVFEEGPSTLVDLPWEILATAAPGMCGAVFPGLQFTRSVPCLDPTVRLNLPRPLRVAVISCSHTHGLKAILSQAVQIVGNALVESPVARLSQQITQTPEISSGMTPEEILNMAEKRKPYSTLISSVDVPFPKLVARIREYDPHIVHLIGTGVVEEQGHLLFASPAGESDADTWVSAAMLGDLLSNSVRLLCLSAVETTPDSEAQIGQDGSLLAFARIASAPGASLPSVAFQTTPTSPADYQAFWVGFYQKLADQEGDLVAAFVPWLKRAYPPMDVGEVSSAPGSGTGFALCIRDHKGLPFRIPPYSKESTEPDTGLENTARGINDGGLESLGLESFSSPEPEGLFGEDFLRRLKNRFAARAREVESFSVTAAGILRASGDAYVASLVSTAETLRRAEMSRQPQTPTEYYESLEGIEVLGTPDEGFEPFDVLEVLRENDRGVDDSSEER